MSTCIACMCMHTFVLALSCGMLPHISRLAGKGGGLNKKSPDVQLARNWLLLLWLVSLH